MYVYSPVVIANESQGMGNDLIHKLHRTELWLQTVAKQLMLIAF